MEEWKPIPGFDGYEVSNSGTIRSYRVKGYSEKRTLIPSFIKPRISQTGYLEVDLRDNTGKKVSRKVHRLVGECFLENPSNKPQIDHIDRNSFNNDITNLRWATLSENSLNRSHQRINKNIHKTQYGFQVVFKQNKVRVVDKFFKSLEEAIAYRDTVLAQNTTRES